MKMCKNSSAILHNAVLTYALPRIKELPKSPEERVLLALELTNQFYREIGLVPMEVQIQEFFLEPEFRNLYAFINSTETSAAMKVALTELVDSIKNKPDFMELNKMFFHTYQSQIGKVTVNELKTLSDCILVGQHSYLFWRSLVDRFPTYWLYSLGAPQDDNNPDGPQYGIDWSKVAACDLVGGFIGPEGAAVASLCSWINQM